jgi:hypothetical protein
MFKVYLISVRMPIDPWNEGDECEVLATVFNTYTGKQGSRRQYGEKYATFHRSSILVAHWSGLMYLISLVNVGDFDANDKGMVQRLEKPSDEDELQPKDGGNIAYEDDMAGFSMHIDCHNDDLDVSVHGPIASCQRAGHVYVQRVGKTEAKYTSRRKYDLQSSS